MYFHRLSLSLLSLISKLFSTHSQPYFLYCQSRFCGLMLCLDYFFCIKSSFSHHKTVFYEWIQKNLLLIFPRFYHQFSPKNFFLTSHIKLSTNEQRKNFFNFSSSLPGFYTLFRKNHFTWKSLPDPGVFSWKIMKMRRYKWDLDLFRWEINSENLSNLTQFLFRSLHFVSVLFFMLLSLTFGICISDGISISFDCKLFVASKHTIQWHNKSLIPQRLIRESHADVNWWY